MIKIKLSSAAMGDVTEADFDAWAARRAFVSEVTMTTNDETKKPLAIRILEGLAEQFAAGRREAPLAPFPPTSSENEREAIRMQRQGRGEAWWGAEVAVQEALERNREALEASASGLIAAAVVKRLDEQAAVISEQRQTIDAHLEHIRILTEGRAADGRALRLLQQKLDDERAARERVNASFEEVQTALRTANREARDLREERDGRGKRIEQLVGDLESLRGYQAITEQQKRDLEAAMQGAIEKDDPGPSILAAGSVIRRLRRAQAELLPRRSLVDLGREVRERADQRKGPGATADAVKLKCAAMLILEVAGAARGDALDVADWKTAKPEAVSAPTEAEQAVWNLRDRMNVQERAGMERDEQIAKLAAEIERLAEIGARMDRELLGRVLKLEEDRVTRVDMHMVERAFSGRCQTLEERVGLEKDRVDTLSAAVREEQQRLDEEAEHRRTLAECVKALQMQSDPARRPL